VLFDVRSWKIVSVSAMVRGVVGPVPNTLEVREIVDEYVVEAIERLVVSEN
jgi:hypothetical protein